MNTGLAFTAAQCTHELICILSESLGEDSVKEGIGTRVDGEEEHEQDLGVSDRDQGDLERSRDGEEGDGSHAEEIGEDKHSHALRHLGVGASSRYLGVLYSKVDQHVTNTHNNEGAHVEEQDNNDEGLSQRSLYVHGKAHADFGVTAHANQRQHPHPQTYEPTGRHYARCLCE